MLKRWLILAAFLVLTFGQVWHALSVAPTTWYVRPANDGNGTNFTYGTGTGLSSGNAFAGFAAMSGIAAGDIICLPGGDEPFFERLDTAVAGSAGLEVSYQGCGATDAVIWHAQGLSGNRSFNNSRALVNTATYAWSTVGTDTYRKRIDVRPRMLWEGTTWLTPQDCNASTEAAAIAALTASHWCVRDNGDSTYWILYRATVTGNTPTNTVIRSEYVPYSDGSTTAIVIADLDYQSFWHIKIRGVTSSSSSRALYFLDTSHSSLHYVTFERNIEGPSIIAFSVPMTDILWDHVVVTDSCSTGVFISPVQGLTRLTVTNSEFSRSAGSCYNGSGFTGGDGDGFAIGQGGGTATTVVLNNIITNGNFNAGIFIGTTFSMTVTDFSVRGWTASGNARFCYGEGDPAKVVGTFVLAGFICRDTTGSTGSAAIHIASSPASRTITIANGTWTGNTNYANLRMLPHANNHYRVLNNVFYVNPQTADPLFDRGDIYTQEAALIGDEVFTNNWLYSRANQAQPFAKIGSTVYNYNGVGALAAFNTATGATGTHLNTDPLLLSTSDLRTQVTSPLRGAGVAYSQCLDVRGRVCNNPPDGGAYQESSGDAVTPPSSSSRSQAPARTQTGPRPPR